jgi:hypothetical protein
MYEETAQQKHELLNGFRAAILNSLKESFKGEIQPEGRDFKFSHLDTDYFIETEINPYQKMGWIRTYRVKRNLNATPHQTYQALDELHLAFQESHTGNGATPVAARWQHDKNTSLYTADALPRFIEAYRKHLHEFLDGEDKLKKEAA